MTITTNLPPRHSDGRFASLGSYGAWEQVGDLNALASALRVGTDTIRADDIKSIPDAWAQIQVFQQALLEPPPTEPSHPSSKLHDDVRSQWRGLLALIALQPEFKHVYDLHVTPLTLSDLEGPGRRLRRVLGDLEPKQTLVEDPHSWNNLGILYFQERSTGSRAQASKPRVPAGLISPVLMVAAGKSRAGLSCANVPWMLKGLTDPLSVRGLTPRHYAILAKFVEGLRDDLEERVADDQHTTFGALSRELASFEIECLAKAGGDHPLVPVDLGFAWPSDLYSSLNKTQTMGDIAPEGSERKLQVRDEFLGKEGLKGAILIDPDEGDDDNVMVWKGYSLSAAKAPQTLAKIKEEAISEGWLIVQPSDIFTHDLIRFVEGANIPAHGRRGFEAALMPFSPLALMLMKPEELAQAAEMSSRGEDCVVTLELPLLNAEGRRSAKRHRLTKRYGPDNVQDEDRPEDLAIWPNFRSRDWHWTFLRFQYDPEYELQPRFGVSAEFIAAEAFGDTASSIDRARRLYEWSNRDELVPDLRMFSDRISRLPASGEPLLMSRLRFAKTPRLVGELQRLPQGVEAIFFARRTDGEGSERPAGLCLVALAEVETNYDESRVAIDFGTTNTVAYEQQGAGQKAAITFQERVLFPIRMTEREAKQKSELATEYTTFFPLRPHDTPFPTVVRRRGYQGELSSENQRLLKDGHDEHGFSDVIFFMPQYDQLTADTYLAWVKANTLVFNIKWAANEKTKLLARRFLRQLMMMVAAELAAKGRPTHSIRWAFSYPQAFARLERDSLRNSIRQAWTDLFGQAAQALGDPSGGSSDDAPTASNRIRLMSESAAAANYFMYDTEKDGRGSANKLMLMLDIGGGTTDVALWYEGSMRWRGSYRVAGGSFFTRYLANNPQILTRIAFGQVASSIKPTDVEISSNFTELFINAPDFAPNFDRAYPTFSMEPEGAGLRHCATAALGGLMHYVGLVLHRLVQGNVIEESDLDHLTVAFGGRGSALFRQYADGEKYDTELSQIVRLAIAAATGKDPKNSRTDTQFSKQPKHEVARGLLIGPQDSSTPDSTIAPLGEAVTYTDRDGKSVTVAAEDDIHALLNAKSVKDPELAEFKQFLIGLKKLTGISIDLDARNGEALRIIKQRVSAKLRTAVKDLSPDDDAEDIQLIEPPFITALRELIDLMNLPVGERDACLVVTEKLK